MNKPEGEIALITGGNSGVLSNIGESERHGDQIVAFEVDHLSLELLGDHQPVRDLVGKA